LLPIGALLQLSLAFRRGTPARGGTANGGSDTGAVATFTITIV
jgi:hypothetical protein